MDLIKYGVNPGRAVGKLFSRQVGDDGTWNAAVAVELKRSEQC